LFESLNLFAADYDLSVDPAYQAPQVEEDDGEESEVSSSVDTGNFSVGSVGLTSLADLAIKDERTQLENRSAASNAKVRIVKNVLLL
jgi:hypothetical protein